MEFGGLEMVWRMGMWEVGPPQVRDRMWWTAEHQGHEGRGCLREFGQLTTDQ